MVDPQFRKGVLYSLLMADEGRAKSLLADKSNNVSHDVLIGHLIPCRVQLFLRKVMAVKLQFQALEVFSGKLRRSGADRSQSGNCIHVIVDEFFEGFQIVLWLLTFAITAGVVNQFIGVIINNAWDFAMRSVLVQHREGLTMSQQFSGGLFNRAAVKVFCKAP